MKLHKLFFYIVGFLSTFLGLQTHAQTMTDANGEPVKPEGGLLWRISGKDLPVPSYVFGTIHAICPEDYFFTEAMIQAFQSTQHLILEVDVNDPMMTDQFQEGMLLPKGKLFSDYFESVEEFDRFSRTLAERKQMDMEMYKDFKPFVMLSALAMKGLTCETTSSYEMNLNKMSRERNMPVSGLETVLFQMNIFDKLDAADMRRLLWESIDDAPGQRDQENQMISLYKQQDLKGLYEMVKNSGEFKGHEKEFLSNRNINWAKKLPDMMRESACFIAVGAAHLPGELGLLNLLAKAGYTLEAVH